MSWLSRPSANRSLSSPIAWSRSASEARSGVRGLPSADPTAGACQPRPAGGLPSAGRTAGACPYRPSSWPVTSRLLDGRIAEVIGRRRPAHKRMRSYASRFAVDALTWSASADQAHRLRSFSRSRQQVLRPLQREMTRGHVTQARTSASAGSSTEQSSWASGHRVRNRQPDGGLIGLGSSPLIPAARLALAIAGRGPGWCAIRPAVYGWRAAGRCRCRRPARPACRGTSRRSGRRCTSTTARSCEMTTKVRPCRACSRFIRFSTCALIDTSSALPARRRR